MGSPCSAATPVTSDPRILRSRAKILDAATELLCEGGSAAVTVDAVAERSGVAKSTMYRHFPSRTELLVSVLDHNLPKPELGETPLDFDGAVRAFVGQVVAALTAPGWARILPALMALKHTIPDVDDLTEADRETRMAQAQMVVDLGEAEGLLPSGSDVRVLLDLLVGPLVFAVINGDVERVPALADEVADRYLAACRAGSPDPA